MWTNGNGTNSVKPPVSSCSARTRSRCRAQCAIALDMAEHDRCGRAQADPVRGAHHLEPLVGRHLVGADDRADLRIEYLGRRTRQRRQARRLQPAEIILQRHAQRAGRRASPRAARRRGCGCSAPPAAPPPGRRDRCRRHSRGGCRPAGRPRWRRARPPRRRGGRSRPSRSDRPGRAAPWCCPWKRRRSRICRGRYWCS